MRYLAMVLSALALVACHSAPAPRGQPETSRDAPVEFLLTSAAADFHGHRPPDPVRFRDVRLGYILAPDSTRQYLLCGAFLAADAGGASTWTPFVTIKTSGYEQMHGAQAAALCERPAVRWTQGDWSSSLESRLAALR